ncbi:hypothetical protein BUALT_Bualt02G0221700 [Buddleja alternifolia]|uniref:Peptidase A1 domain-containing protein n=1 Tax=Buddleja alternifolia TaxID=168488 RepID=A0AAV6YD42_9LAMI|nr:hypothetical protein BUALT_Bualt02G0221700 [Buddleja alternifolia]
MELPQNDFVEKEKKELPQKDFVEMQQLELEANHATFSGHHFFPGLCSSPQYSALSSGQYPATASAPAEQCLPSASTLAGQYPPSASALAGQYPPTTTAPYSAPAHSQYNATGFGQYPPSAPARTNTLADISKVTNLAAAQHRNIALLYFDAPSASQNCSLLRLVTSDIGSWSLALLSSLGSHGSCSLNREPPGDAAAVDSLYMPTTDGRNPGQLSLITGFTFLCTERSSIKGLVRGASGIAGLGRSRLSMAAQVSNISSQDLMFALCLSGSPSAPGVAFFGSSGPYYFYPEIDLSKYLNYTPLLSTPARSTAKSHSNNPSHEYFISLTSIKVNGKVIEFDRTLLTVDHKGYGGTKLSSVTPYTRLQTTIFKALTEAFVNESAALNLTVTTPVKPFKVCYNADDVMSTRVGPGVPTVDLVLHEDDVVWRIFGSNSMVRIFRGGADVWCLGVVDGGAKPKTAIVIGGHQMEDNLLQFDLESKRLGFSSSVLVHGTMCANFNFTTNNNLR